MLRTMQNVWLPDPGGWMTGWASLGKITLIVFEVLSRVVGGLSPAPSYVAITGFCLRCWSSRLIISQALLSCPRVHCLLQSHRCGAGLVSLYCIWQWPPSWLRLFILVTLAEMSTAAQWATTDFHTQGDQATRRSVVSLVSNLPVP